jgi:hypothetical protein
MIFNAAYRVTPALVGAALMAVVHVTSPAFADQHAAGRVSGQVIELRTDGRLVVAEQGPWQGPGTGVVTRILDLTPGTAVRAVRPTGKWESDSSPGWEVRQMSVKDVKPGDFVTVVTDGTRRKAVALDVVLTDDRGGMALPGPGR